MQQCMRCTSILRSGHQYQQQRQKRAFWYPVYQLLDNNCFLLVILGGDWKYDNIVFIYICIYFKLYKGNLFVKEQSAISLPLSVTNFLELLQTWPRHPWLFSSYWLRYCTASVLLFSKVR